MQRASEINENTLSEHYFARIKSSEINLLSKWYFFNDLFVPEAFVSNYLSNIYFLANCLATADTIARLFRFVWNSTLFSHEKLYLRQTQPNDYYSSSFDLRWGSSLKITRSDIPFCLQLFSALVCAFSITFVKLFSLERIYGKKIMAPRCNPQAKLTRDIPTYSSKEGGREKKQAERGGE